MPNRVLLVEGSSIIRAALVPALKELANVEVVGFADDVSSALNAISRMEFDIVVLDLSFAAGSGLAVLEGMPSPVLDGRKVLVLTSYADPEVHKECIRLGATAVFDRATEIDEFLKACAQR